MRTHQKEIEPDWKLSSLYAPIIYRNNPKLQKLIMRNDKIYFRQQKYISNPPKDLNLIQVAPQTELECGVISSSLEDILMDYRHGLELGLDVLPELRTLATNLAD